MAATPMVSVIIPTYNRADLIFETLQSVLVQTYENFEILVVDDGSTDGTEPVVSSFSDPRIRFLRVPHVGLPAGPRNTGIRNARGKYVAFLDSDDLWLPRKLEQQVGFLEMYDFVDLLYSQCVGFVDGGRTVGDPSPAPDIAKTGYIFDDLILSDNYIPCLTVMVRKAVLDKTGLFNADPVLRAVEDFDLWLRIAQVARVGFLPEVLAKYRIHPGGISSSRSKMLKNWLYLLDKYEEARYIRNRTLRIVRFSVYLQLALQHVRSQDAKDAVFRNVRLAFSNIPPLHLLLKMYSWKIVRRLRRTVRGKSARAQVKAQTRCSSFQGLLCL